MNKTFESNIVDKLALQVDSFQEGFQILSGSKSLKEMAEQFVVLLRGNFLVTKVNVFYKQSIDAEWETLQAKNDYKPKQIDNCDHSRMQLSYDLSASTKICVNLPLVDKSFIGITIGNKLDRSEFSEFDKITLQIFLQLLDLLEERGITTLGDALEASEKIFEIRKQQAKF